MPTINLSKKNISLDLQHIGYTNTIYAQQGDVDSRQLTIRLFDNGEAYIIPDNATVSLCGTRADKTIIYRDVDAFNGNEITITFKNEELAASGIAKYKIEIKNVSNDGTEKLLTSAPFKLKIYQNIYDENGKLAAPQYSDLKRELDSIHSQEEALRVAEENREQRSSIAIANTEQATATAISAVNDLQNKLDSHHFVLTEDKDTAGGVAGLDTNSKVSNSRLYEASASTKGITQLNDSVTSSSSSRAATSKAVKTAYDKAVSANAELHTHNSSSTSHDDLRNLISDLTTRLNALADSDDTTLDQLSEIVAYIKNNKSLIDNVTTSKVNVSDIINSLTSTAANKPLSAKQGKVLNDLITELTAAIENKLDESSLESKVSKDGDEMSGELVLKNGSIVAREAGTSGVYGYVKMIQIKILRQYVNYPVIFEITGRGWTSSNKLYVQFKNDSGSDPQLNSFLIDNTPQYKVAIVKSATSTWDIYMQKSESYGMCAVCRMCNTNYTSGSMQITFPDTLVSSIPEGAVEPTVMSWDKAKNADTVDGKHFSDIKELIDVKQNIRNGTVGESVDWNTITTAGAYKVQYATMSDDKHSPVGEYRFGILYVIDSEVGGETRIMQMYFPHQPNISPIHIRMRNNGIWRDWIAVTSAIGATGNAATLGGMNKNQFVHRANPVLDGNVTCKKNIWFSGENGANTMIMFLDSGDNTGQGISIGGGGLTIIGGGESAGAIANYYTNNGDVKAGGNENMIVANDGVIDFYTNCQNGFPTAKHITMNTDGTITASGFNGNATSASCVLDGGDNRKTYMKYSANCVDDFTYLAVWNPISGGVELRAFAKTNLKDKLGLMSLSGGTISGNLELECQYRPIYDNSGNQTGVIPLGSPYSITIKGVANQPYGGVKIDKDGIKATIVDGYEFICGGIGVNSDWWPNSTITRNLGRSYSKWGTVYAETGTINTSDKNLKKNIENLGDSWVEFFMKIQPKSFMFKDGTSGRTHIGFISQDIEDTLEECGLSSLDFAGFCKDIKKVSVTKHKTVTSTIPNPETGEPEEYETEEAYIDWEDVLDDDGNPEYIYSLRYEEFIALNTMMIQKIYRKNLDIEKRLNLIEQSLDK